MSAFILSSSRIACSDRLVGTGNFDLVPIGLFKGTNQPVVAPFQQTIVKAPRSFTEQFDSNKGQNFGLSYQFQFLIIFQLELMLTGVKLMLKGLKICCLKLSSIYKIQPSL